MTKGKGSLAIHPFIAHAWNVDLATARSWRELYGIDDSVRTRED